MLSFQLLYDLVLVLITPNLRLPPRTGLPLADYELANVSNVNRGVFKVCDVHGTLLEKLCLAPCVLTAFD